MSEVLAKQPPAMRDFLLRTCVVDELDPGLVGALTGRHCDPRVLQFIAHGNAFVEPVPGRRGCYRYQSLFREFLRSQLEFENPALLPVLHRSAAAWLAEEGRLPAAIRHAVAGQAWTMATRYVVEGLGFVRPADRGPPRPADGAPRPAPRRHGGRRGRRDPGRAGAVRAGHGSLCRPSCGWPGPCWSATTPPGSTRARWRSWCWRRSPRVSGPDLDRGLDAALAAEYALQRAAVQDEVAHLELRAVVAGALGRVLVQRGDLTAARTALTEGVRVAESAQLGQTTLELRGMAALVEALSGNLRLATELTSGSGLHADDTGRPCAVALSRRRRWRSPGCARTVTTCAPRGTSSGTPREPHRPTTRGSSDLSWRCSGPGCCAPRASSRWPGRGCAPRRPGRDAAPTTGWLDRRLVLAQAASFLAEGNRRRRRWPRSDAAACEHLEGQLLERRALRAAGARAPEQPVPSLAAVASAPLETQVVRWLVLAGQAVDDRDTARAEFCVDRALRLAAPEHLRRPFFEAPADVRGLLEHDGLTVRSRWLRTGVPRTWPSARPPATAAQGSSRPAGDPGGPPTVENPLTAKEQEVLGYLADLLTTEEIARTMFVSVNTVRSHVRSILRKLGVTRRNEAVRRAWDMRLLPRRGAA